MQREKAGFTSETDEILISVIVPVYNSANYLRETLNSIIHQTYRKLEIIIIDDGSNDGSEIICDQYAEIDNRVRVIHHNSNLGLSAARNSGLVELKGQIMMFLDSDDVFHTDAIRRMYDVMTIEGVDLVACRTVNKSSEEELNSVSKLQLQVGHSW